MTAQFNPEMTMAHGTETLFDLSDDDQADNRKKNKYSHIEKEIDDLFSAIGKYRSVDAMTEFLLLFKKYPRMKPFNVLLVNWQRRGHTLVMSAEKWEKRYNRRVKPSAIPMVILRPYGPVGFVFDICDTVGDPLPKEIEQPFMVNGKLPNGFFNRLIKNALCEGIEFSLQNFGSQKGGQAAFFPSSTVITRPKNEYHIRTLFELACNSEHIETERCLTAFHELAHVYCGHVKCDDGSKYNYYDKEAKGYPQRYDLSTEEMEFEAETVKYIVCNQLGIDSRDQTLDYLQEYVNKDGSLPDVGVATMAKAAGKIEDLCMKSSLDIRKEIILEKKEIITLRGNKRAK